MRRSRRGRARWCRRDSRSEPGPVAAGVCQSPCLRRPDRHRASLLAERRRRGAGIAAPGKMLARPRVSEVAGGAGSAGRYEPRRKHGGRRTCAQPRPRPANARLIVGDCARSVSDSSSRRVGQRRAALRHERGLFAWRTDGRCTTRTPATARRRRPRRDAPGGCCATPAQPADADRVETAALEGFERFRGRRPRAGAIRRC